MQINLNTQQDQSQIIGIQFFVHVRWKNDADTENNQSIPLPFYTPYFADDNKNIASLIETIFYLLADETRDIAGLLK